jgi:small multidrug resistance family-3 protein
MNGKDLTKGVRTDNTDSVAGRGMRVKILMLMLVSGILEVGGGYGVWVWIKDRSPLGVGLAGMAGLALYGVVAALEPLPFGRAYAAYGGVFVVLSLLFAMKIDGFRPDRWDMLGAGVIGAGVLILLYGPGRS